MVRPVVLCLLLAACGDSSSRCGFDVQCPLGNRCASGRCIPIAIPRSDGGLDATVPDSAVPATDGAPPVDAGPDSGGPTPDTTFTCTLALDGGPLILGFASDRTSAPRVVGWAEGWAVVFRETSEAGGTQPTVAMIGFDLASVGTVPLQAGTIEPDLAIAAAPGTAEDLLVAWTDSETMFGASVYRLGTDPPYRAVTLAGPAASTAFPSLATVSDGYVLALSNREPGSNQLLTLRLARDGQPLGAPLPVLLPGPATRPALGSLEDANVQMAWRDSRGGEARLWAAGVDEDGAVSAPFSLSDGPLVLSAEVAVTPWGAFYAWTATGNPASVLVSRAHSADIDQSTVASAAELDPHASIAFDGRGLFVAWREGTGARAPTRVQMLRGDLTAASGILDLPERAAMPRLAVVASSDQAVSGVGAGVVAWINGTTFAVELQRLVCTE